MSKTQPATPQDRSADPPASPAANRPGPSSPASQWVQWDKEQRARSRARARETTARLKSRGLAELSVTVPEQAVDTVKAICDRLRDAHEQARRAREAQGTRPSPHEAQVEALVRTMILEAADPETSLTMRVRQAETVPPVPDESAPVAPPPIADAVAADEGPIVDGQPVTDEDEDPDILDGLLADADV